MDECYQAHKNLYMENFFSLESLSLSNNAWSSLKICFVFMHIFLQWGWFLSFLSINQLSYGFIFWHFSQTLVYMTFPTLKQFTEVRTVSFFKRDSFLWLVIHSFNTQRFTDCLLGLVTAWGPRDSEKNWTNQAFGWKTHKQNNNRQQVVMSARKKQNISGIERTWTWMEESWKTPLICL